MAMGLNHRHKESAQVRRLGISLLSKQDNKWQIRRVGLGLYFFLNFLSIGTNIFSDGDSWKCPIKIHRCIAMLSRLNTAGHPMSAVCKACCCFWSAFLLGKSRCPKSERSRAAQVDNVKEQWPLKSEGNKPRLSWSTPTLPWAKGNSHLTQVLLWALASPPHHLRVHYLLIQSRGLPHQGSSSSFKTPAGPRTKMIFLGPAAKKWVYPVSCLALRWGERPLDLWGPGLQAVIHSLSLATSVSWTYSSGLCFIQLPALGVLRAWLASCWKLTAHAKPPSRGSSMSALPRHAGYDLFWAHFPSCLSPGSSLS